MSDAPTPPRRPADPDEAARFLREQPPAPVPRRILTPPLAGLTAYTLLGAQVIKPGAAS